ncbi:hypothetical protein [Gracilimonas mengyeensis]|uniref:hypothetical protein n=1 Tax=Gracilimonas mengyeensis TaxID=1302730 RepID=UPI001C8F831E|nr:hypothetical protein [Gracilimonas mengyeensis]
MDSTSPEAYVHISRDAAPGEHTVNIQANPQYFNALQEPTKRSHVEQAAPGTHLDLANYTLGKNAHVTLEGRYAYVMTQLAGGFADLAGIKSGPPVVGDFANLNFGSYEDHGEVQKSEKDIFTYISNYAEDAADIVGNREERFEGEKAELLKQINDVESETASFTDRLIQGSALKDLDDGNFVHYGGEPWDPIIPEDLQ